LKCYYKGDRKCRFRGPTRNGVQAADCRDMRPLREGSIYVLGCSHAPRIIFGTCPFHRDTFSAFFCSVLGIPIATRRERVHQWEVPATYNGMPQVCPNTTACAPISMYSQGQGSLEHFGNKSEGNIQVQCIVYFVSRSSSVLLLICYFRLDHFIFCFTTLVMDNRLRCISIVQAMKCVFSPSKSPYSPILSAIVTYLQKSLPITKLGNT